MHPFSKSPAKKSWVFSLAQPRNSKKCLNLPQLTKTWKGRREAACFVCFLNQAKWSNSTVLTIYPNVGSGVKDAQETGQTLLLLIPDAGICTYDWAETASVTNVGGLHPIWWRQNESVKFTFPLLELRRSPFPVLRTYLHANILSLKAGGMWWSQAISLLLRGSAEETEA